MMSRTESKAVDTPATHRAVVAPLAAESAGAIADGALDALRLTPAPPSGKSVEAAITLWLDAKAKRSGSRETAHAYERTIRAFRRVCQAAGGDLDAPDHRRLANLLQVWAGADKPNGKPVANATFNRHLATIGSFYRFCLKRGALDTPENNPADFVDRHEVEPYQGAHALDMDALKARLAELNAATAHSRLALRDRALITLALLSGKRAAELASLRLQHLRITDSGQVTTVHWSRLKGGKTDDLRLDVVSSAALETWLRAAYPRQKLTGLDGELPVWPALDQRAHRRAQERLEDGLPPLGLTTQALADIWRKWLGTSKVHASRHTFAALAREAGASIAEIQGLLGHANIATTQLYVRRLEMTTNPHAAKMAALLGLQHGDMHE